MPPMAFFLALQAAGMITDWMGTQQQIKMGRIGTQLEQAGINANIEMTKVQSADASLQAMKQLRQTLGSQAAIMAARGTRSGAGSSVAIQQQSVSNYQSDERMRRMNLLAKEAELRAQNVLSGMHQLQSETQLGQALTKRIFDKLPTSPQAWSEMGKSFGMTGAEF